MKITNQSKTAIKMRCESGIITFEAGETKEIPDELVVEVLANNPASLVKAKKSVKKKK